LDAQAGRDGSSHDDVRRLIREAERKAQIFTGYARLAIAAVTLVVFLAANRGAVPIEKLVLQGLWYYSAVAVLSILLASSRWFRAWHGSAFAVIDAVVLAAFLDAVMRTLGLPPGHMFATPSFVFLFVILTISAMRFTAIPIFLTLAAFVATYAVLSNLDYVPWVEGTSGDPPDVIRLYGDNTPAVRFALVLIVAAIAALAVRRARQTLTRAIMLGQQTANLSRYLPQRIAAVVADQGVGVLTRGRRQNAAVMFADVRGFTALSESVPPEEIGRMLGELRGIVTRAVERNHGIVDKFIGDAVMAVFGVPEPGPRDAANALAATRDILRELEHWNAARATRGEPAVRLGIGVHYGEVFAGAVGDASRLEFTILGDTVNVAARVEEATKAAGAGLVVTESLLAAAEADRSEWHPLEQEAVRGRAQPVRMYRYALR
jgi:adenylate cyclase